MGEILGLGLTHYPPLIGTDENMASILRTVLKDPGLAGALPRPRQLAGADAARVRRRRRHRLGAPPTAPSLVRHFRHARKLLDDFRPDVVVIWGDDQHENFTEDIIPPFCVLAYDEVEARHRPRDAAPNVWGEGPGHRASASRATARPASTWPRRLLEQGVDMAYAYKPLHHQGLAHAFLNTVLYLDYDRDRLPVPGRRLPGELLRPARDRPAGRARQPGPSARRGRPRSAVALAEAVHGGRRGGRAGHAREPLAGGAHRLLELVARVPHRQEPPALSRHPEPTGGSTRRCAIGDYDTWRDAPLAAIEASGQQEMLNWYMLAGAMEALGRKPDECEFVETWSFNSNKCFAVFKP